MRGQRWLIGAITAVALAQTGCVACCHKGYQNTLEHGPDCDLPAHCRNRVYTFLINGLTPPTHNGLSALRLKLGENGYAKVGIADLAGGLCVEREVEKIRACEPDAKFVLVGYDVGAAVAVCAARDLATKGIPVETVVLLDPVGCKDACGAPTLLITSAKEVGTVPHSQRLIVPGVGHFGLPAHPTTVAALVDLLGGIAANCEQPVADVVPDWTYPHAPEMRPTPVAGRDGDWNFLTDAGPTRPIGTGVATRPTTPAPSTAAGPVVLKR